MYSQPISIIKDLGERASGMSRGFGKLQVAIFEYLRVRAGGDDVEAHHDRQIKLAPGVHDTRQVAREMALDLRASSNARTQRSFSRAVAGLLEHGVLKAYANLVPIAEYGPGTAWTKRVLNLPDGLFLDLPSGVMWQGRFVAVAERLPARISEDRRLPS